MGFFCLSWSQALGLQALPNMSHKTIWARQALIWALVPHGRGLMAIMPFFVRALAPSIAAPSLSRSKFLQSVSSKTWAWLSRIIWAFRSNKKLKCEALTEYPTFRSANWFNIPKRRYSKQFGKLQRGLWTFFQIVTKNQLLFMARWIFKIGAKRSKIFNLVASWWSSISIFLVFLAKIFQIF